MKPRRLIPTELSEVSVLRRAANPLAKVLIRKSQQENDPMGDIGVVSIAKRSVSAITKGEIDQVSFAKLQLRLAQEQFPQDSLGVALTTFYATPRPVRGRASDGAHRFRRSQIHVAKTQARQAARRRRGWRPH